MEFLKQSTAATVKMGPFVDSTDGNTDETGLTISQADIRLSKNGGNMAQTNNAAGAPHDEIGYYDVPLDATDTGTLGRLKVMIHESGALPVWQDFMVLPANAFDSLFGADNLQVDILQLGGDAQSATDLKDFADAGYDPATNKVQGVVLVDTTTTNTDMVGTDSAALASVCTEARLAELDAANLPADVDAILVDTNSLNNTKIPQTLNLTASGNIGIDWANVENPTTALDLSGTDIQLVDTVTTYTGNTVQTGDNFARLGAPSDLGGGATVAANLSDMAGATFATGTDSQEAIRDRGDAAWTTGAGGSDRLLMVDTTIATLASQTSFTLTSGSADDDAYNNCTIVVEDVSTSTQKAVGLVSDYTGSTKTVTLKYDPGVFTMATTDKIYILAENALKSTEANRQLDVTATGAAGIDWANIENPTTAVDLSGTDIQLCDTITTYTGNTPQTADHTANIATLLTGVPQMKYNGPHGPGVYIDSGAANTNTVEGTDGTFDNPVSTFTAARTIADALGTNGVKVYYIVGNSDLTLAATHEDWLFVGMGEVTSNVVNLGSQDVDRSQFVNLTIEGTQGGSERISAVDCALQDPGAGATTLHIFAARCGIVDDVTVDTSNDNVFDSCYSLVAGTSAPIIRGSGATGSISIRHYSGGVELASLSASHNVSVETDGQVIFNADCNVNATVAIRGMLTLTDNTAGMNNLSTDAAFCPRMDGIEGATFVTGTDSLESIRDATALATVCTEARLAELDAANLPADIDAIQVNTQDLQTQIGTAGAGLTDLGGMSTGMMAEIESEVNDALDTAISELGVAAPTATPTIRTGLMLLYMALRNKTVVQTSGTDALELYNNAGTKIAAKLLTDDGSDYTEAEMA